MKTALERVLELEKQVDQLKIIAPIAVRAGIISRGVFANAMDIDRADVDQVIKEFEKTMLEDEK